MYDLDACRMDDRCRTRTRAGTADRLWDPGPAGGRGLCRPDELHGRHAIEQLHGDWLLLSDAVAKDAGRSGIAAMGGGKAEAPIPIHLHIDAAARRIAWMLDVWAGAVHERLPVAEKGRGGDFTERGVRQSWAVARSARILTRFYPALLALGPTTFMPYGDDHTEPAENDGPGAIIDLADLHHRARTIIGETKRYEHRDLPCPKEPLGCGIDNVLVREVGEEHVHCVNCGWWCTTSEYDLYAITFLPPTNRRRLEVPS